MILLVPLSLIHFNSVHLSCGPQMSTWVGLFLLTVRVQKTKVLGCDMLVPPDRQTHPLCKYKNNLFCRKLLNLNTFMICILFFLISFPTGLCQCLKPADVFIGNSVKYPPQMGRNATIPGLRGQCLTHWTNGECFY